MGITAYIYRNDVFADCSLNGWSNRFKEVTVVNAEGPFEPTPERPAVRLVAHRTVHSIHAVSEEDLESGEWTMFGGCFLHSSDSRFGRLCMELMKESGISTRLGHYGHGAVPIHDRIEG